MTDAGPEKVGVQFEHPTGHNQRKQMLNNKKQEYDTGQHLQSLTAIWWIGPAP